MMSCGSFTRGVVDSFYITATTFLCSLVIIPYVMTYSVAGFIVVNSLVIIEPAPQGFITPLPIILPSFSIVDASVA